MMNTNRKKVIVFSFTLFLLGLAGMGHANSGQNNTGGHKLDTLNNLTLRGLNRVFVEVEGIHRDFAKFGLDSETLRDQIETELGGHGLEIASREALMNEPDVARLRIKVNANENQYRFYHYGVRLELAQKIPMNQHGGFVAETTWTSGRTGVIMPMDLRRLGTYAQDLLSVFLKDYHTQNPKVAGLE